MKKILESEKKIGVFLLLGSTFIAMLIVAGLSVLSAKVAGFYAITFAIVTLALVVKYLIATVAES